MIYIYKHTYTYIGIKWRSMRSDGMRKRTFPVQSLAVTCSYISKYMPYTNRWVFTYIAYMYIRRYLQCVCAGDYVSKGMYYIV